MKLYLHRGASRLRSASEDREQASDRWCSFSMPGQEFWQILSQWMGNLRQHLRKPRQPTLMRLDFRLLLLTLSSQPASAQAASHSTSDPSSADSSGLSCAVGACGSCGELWGRGQRIYES